jgi:SH3-like domain-containing protein
MSMANFSFLQTGWWRQLVAGFALGMLLVAAGEPDALAQGSLDASAPALPSYSKNVKAPSYASLKTDHVFLRQGPGADQPTVWLLQRLGLPVEILEEQEGWRKVRDASGAVGWVDAMVLSRRRTALILPWEVKDGQAQVPSATLREDDYESARGVVAVEAGVLANIIGCQGGWCRVSVGNYRGYVEQKKLWGTYPDEEIK